ncbi:MAG: SH3 domain-containing protein [Acidobacteria bacterium]|nr:SH3 domain-containing protein [Acidobacteriota bacterium]
MTGKYLIPCVSLRLVVIILIIGVPFCVPVHAKRKVLVPGQHAIVFDEGLSALRKQPDLKAALVQRLRRGRVVGILGDVRNKSGARFLKVAISRNTQGWVLADAVVRPGRIADAERLMMLIGETRDDFTKVKLARLCADEFRATKFAPRALLILGEAAERAAERLTRDAKRRIGDEESSGGLERRYYFLNYVGLDRYNRLGVTFDYDETEDRISYDGSAYRELLRRYPRSAEVKIVRERSQR